MPLVPSVFNIEPRSRRGGLLFQTDSEAVEPGREAGGSEQRVLDQLGLGQSRFEGEKRRGIDELLECFRITDPSADHVPEFGLHPDLLRRSESHLGPPRPDARGQEFSHRFAKDGFGLSSGEEVLRRYAHRMFHQLVVDEGDSCFDAVSHAGSIFVSEKRGKAPVQ